MDFPLCRPGRVDRFVCASHAGPLIGDRESRPNWPRELKGAATPICSDVWSRILMMSVGVEPLQQIQRPTQERSVDRRTLVVSRYP